MIKIDAKSSHFAKVKNVLSWYVCDLCVLFDKDSSKGSRLKFLHLFMEYRFGWKQRVLVFVLASINYNDRRRQHLTTSVIIIDVSIYKNFHVAVRIWNYLCNAIGNQHIYAL